MTLFASLSYWTEQSAVKYLIICLREILRCFIDSSLCSGWTKRLNSSIPILLSKLKQSIALCDWLLYYSSFANAQDDSLLIPILDKWDKKVKYKACANEWNVKLALAFRNECSQGSPKAAGLRSIVNRSLLFVNEDLQCKRNAVV